MRAEFIKCFVDCIKGSTSEKTGSKDALYAIDELEKYKSKAQELWEKMISYKLFSYYGYDDKEERDVNYFEQMIDLLGRWNDNDVETYINRFYGCVEIEELIYWTIFLVKNGLSQESGDVIFEDFLESIENDYRPDRCEDVPSLILYYVLYFDKSLEIWRDLLEDWEKEKFYLFSTDVIETKYDATSVVLYLNFEKQVKDFNYTNLKQSVDEGLSEVDQKTRKSVQEINNSIYRMQDKGEETKIIKVFGINLLEHVFNCQRRRKWYMFRMMQRIIEFQIDEFVSVVAEYQKALKKINTLWIENAEKIIVCYADKERQYSKYNNDKKLFKVSEEYKWTDLEENSKLTEEIDINLLAYSLKKNKSDSKWYEKLPKTIQDVINQIISWQAQVENLQKKLKKLEKELWIKKGSNDAVYRVNINSWNELCKMSNELARVNIDDLKIDLENSRIVPGRINRAFNSYFEGVKEEKGNAMAKYEIRYDAHWDKDLEFDGIYSEMHEGYSKPGEIKAGEKRPGEERLKNLILGKKEVTREMLLLMGLLHKAVVGEETDLEYLQGHVLHYSRLSPKFRNTQYEQYVEEVYNTMNEIKSREVRISELKSASKNIEEFYLKTKERQKGIAIFYSIMNGRRIEK